MSPLNFGTGRLSINGKPVGVVNTKIVGETLVMNGQCCIEESCGSCGDFISIEEFAKSGVDPKRANDLVGDGICDCEESGFYDQGVWADGWCEEWGDED